MTRAEPNFFIIGAPKCGTTSLARWLEQHPAVYMSPIKEPHFYSEDLANRTITLATRYRRLFKGARDSHRAVGEASTWYLFSRDAVPNIERNHPAARYIVMTRDPVAMAHSLYHHNKRVLHDNQPTFEAAWRLQDERAANRSIPPSCTEPTFLQYKAACSLGSLLERLYRLVPAERVLHVRLEAMQSQSREVYRRVLAFLDVPDEARASFPIANVAREHRSRTLQHLLRLGGRTRVALGINRSLGLGRLNDRRESKEDIREAFRDELDCAFANERARLARLRSAME